jgi:N-acetylglucosamine kinase
MAERYPRSASTHYVCTDTFGGLYTGTRHGGMVLIAGTGSNCRLINPDGTEANAGGWGHMMGDEGSGYAIAHTALKTLFDVDDRMHPNWADVDTTWIRAAMQQYFDVTERIDMLPHLYSDFDKTKFAGFTSVVCKGAREGDGVCVAAVESVGHDLARHVVALSGQIDPNMKTGEGWTGVDIVCTGSVWKSWELLKGAFMKEMGSGAPALSFRLLTLVESPAVGAAYVACRSIGDVLPVDFASNTTVLCTHRLED